MSDTKFKLKDPRHPSYKLRFAKFGLPKRFSIHPNKLFRRMMAQALYEQSRKKSTRIVIDDTE